MKENSRPCTGGKGSRPRDPGMKNIKGPTLQAQRTGIAAWLSRTDHCPPTTTATTPTLPQLVLMPPMTHVPPTPPSPPNPSAPPTPTPMPPKITKINPSPQKIVSQNNNKMPLFTPNLTHFSQLNNRGNNKHHAPNAPHAPHTPHAPTPSHRPTTQSRIQ